MGSRQHLSLQQGGTILRMLRCGLGSTMLLVTSLHLAAQEAPPLKAARSSDAFHAGATSRLGSRLRDRSVPAESSPGPAARVFRLLVEQVGSSPPQHWELRILRGALGNAFSLPGGAVYVDSEMAAALADRPGLWAALLSHEIVHTAEQHWARQLPDSALDLHFYSRLFASGEYLPLSSLEDRSEERSAFLRDLELQADAGGLRLMVRAGFHPDFLIALFHLMEAQEGDPGGAIHPTWHARESQLTKKRSVAIAEFEKRWPDSDRSPGGGPPALAFLDPPSMRLAPDERNAEIALPLRCENTTEVVKVVLLVRGLGASNAVGPTGSLEQTLACGAEQTLARFALPRNSDAVEGEFYVMDERGWTLARSQRFRLKY